jgi:hypothetical protein
MNKNKLISGIILILFLSTSYTGCFGDDNGNNGTGSNKWNIKHTDPVGDVEYYVNATTYGKVGGHNDIDIIELKSEDKGDKIKVTLKVYGDAPKTTDSTKKFLIHVGDATVFHNGIIEYWSITLDENEVTIKGDTVTAFLKKSYVGGSGICANCYEQRDPDDLYKDECGGYLKTPHAN